MVIVIGILLIPIIILLISSYIKNKKIYKLIIVGVESAEKVFITVKTNNQD